jgi:AraC-like DNA-binding protein
LISNKKDTIVECVEQAVRRAPKNASQNLEDIALALSMSARSIQRRLKDEGTTFSQVLERSNRQEALQLLVKETLNISEIARMLGYSDPSNFGRAFRKWTGQSPNGCQSKMLEKRPNI